MSGVEKSGPIFIDGIINKEVIQPALDSAAQLGLQRIRDLTPVDTGRARRGWDIERSKPVIIANPVEYVDYLERGTSRTRAVGMVKQSIPYIERQIEENISDNVRAIQ